MKLTEKQVAQAATQLDARPVPENSQMAPELRRVFGDHSFFLTSSGLHLIEQADAQAATGRLVRVASWADAGHTALRPHEPEVTDQIIALEEAA